LIAWLVGFVITIPFIGSATLPWSGQTWQGPLAHLLGGMDISGIIGAIVSGLLYFLLSRNYFKHRASEAVTTEPNSSHQE
jgi:NCS1 family nucleobase:cation symporter-1